MGAGTDPTLMAGSEGSGRDASPSRRHPPARGKTPPVGGGMGGPSGRRAAARGRERPPSRNEGMPPGNVMGMDVLLAKWYC